MSAIPKIPTHTTPELAQLIQDHHHPAQPDTSHAPPKHHREAHLPASPSRDSPGGMTLPDMTLPFSSTCHPAIEKIEHDTLDWASRWVTPQMLKHLAKTRAGRIAARTANPTAPLDLLMAYARMLAWGFWFDDVFVDDLSADSPLHLPATASVLDIVDTGAGTGAAGRELEAAFTDVITGLRDVLSPHQFDMWRNEMRVWFTSMAFQNAMRRSTNPPTIATYKTVRLYTVCTFACVVLIDASNGPVVNWDDYNEPALTTLRINAANVVAWHNDVFSFHAEQTHPGQFWNLPSIYIAHGHSTDQAIRRTAQDAAHEVQKFQQHEAALTNQLSPARRWHIESLKRWMRGCYDWSHEATERYAGWAH